MYSRLTVRSHVRHVFDCVALLLLVSAGVTQANCPDHLWWNTALGACTACTVCEKRFIVLRPCQPHQDTVCGTINDLDYDLNWIVTAEHRRQTKVRSSNSNWGNQWNLMFSIFPKQNPFDFEVIEKSSMETFFSDWQMFSLAIAVGACVLFFVAAACLFWQHRRYWKKMDRMEQKYNAGLSLF